MGRRGIQPLWRSLTTPRAPEGHSRVVLRPQSSSLQAELNFIRNRVGGPQEKVGAIHELSLLSKAIELNVRDRCRLLLLLKWPPPFPQARLRHILRRGRLSFPDLSAIELDHNLTHHLPRFHRR